MNKICVSAKKRPFLVLLCMFLAGVLLRLGFWPAFFVLPVCLLAVWERRGRDIRRFLVPFLGLLLFAAGVWRTESELRFRDTYLQGLSDGQEVRLVGEIVRTEVKPRCICYYLTDCVLDRSNGPVPCSDVLAYASSDEYSIGQILVVRGTITLFDTARNEGGFDARSHYRSQKIDFGVWVNAVESASGTVNRYTAFLARLRGRLSDSVAACGGADGILGAMLLGEKAGLDAEVKSLYQRAGISHILAISGLHVSLLGIGLYRLLRRCRLTYGAASAVTAVLMLSYCVMSGSSVSAKRAVGMLLVCLLADVLGRGYDMLSALGLLGIVLLWDNPFLAGYSGFVFSVTAVFGVGIAAPVFAAWGGSVREEEEREDTLAGRWRKRWCSVKSAFLSGLGIQLTTLPLVALYYYEIPVYAIFLNLLVLMLVKYVVALGAAAAVLGVWSVRLGTLLMLPCNWILALYEKCCTGLLALPYAAVAAGCPGPVRLFAYYGLFAAVLCVMHRRTLQRLASAEAQTGRDMGHSKNRMPAGRAGCAPDVCISSGVCALSA